MTADGHAAGDNGFSLGVLFNGAGTAINLVFLFVETMIAARVLSTEDFGVCGILIVTVNLLCIAVDFDCKTSLTHMLASGDEPSQGLLASSVVGFRFIILLVIASAVWFGREGLVWLDSSRILPRYAAYLPIMLAVTSLDELLLAGLQGCRAFRQMAVAQVVRSVLRLALSSVLLLVFDLGILGLIYSWIVSFAVSTVYEYVVLPVPKTIGLSWYLLKETLHFGAPLQMNRLLYFAVGRADVLLLGALTGPANVALYNIAGRIPTALDRLMQAYVAVYFPTMATLQAKGRQVQAQIMMNQSLRLVSFAMALAALSAVVFSEHIVTLLFSAKYVASSTVFGLLMIVLHMNTIGNLMGYTLTSIGHPGRSFAVNSLQTAVTLAADLLLIPVLMFAGPAVAGLLASYTANPVAVWLLRRSNVGVETAAYLIQTALLLSCVAFFWLVRPASILVGLLLIALFVALSLLLSTTSVDDAGLLLPDGVIRRVGALRGALPNGRH